MEDQAGHLTAAIISCLIFSICSMVGDTPADDAHDEDVDAEL